MARNTVDVIPNHDRSGWNVKKSDAQRASIYTETKAEAVKMGRVISQRSGSKLVVHDKKDKK